MPHLRHFYPATLISADPGTGTVTVRWSEWIASRKSVDKPLFDCSGFSIATDVWVDARRRTDLASEDVSLPFHFEIELHLLTLAVIQVGDLLWSIRHSDGEGTDQGEGFKELRQSIVTAIKAEQWLLVGRVLIQSESTEGHPLARLASAVDATINPHIGENDGWLHQEKYLRPFKKLLLPADVAIMGEEIIRRSADLKKALGTQKLMERLSTIGVVLLGALITHRELQSQDGGGSISLSDFVDGLLCPDDLCVTRPPHESDFAWEAMISATHHPTIEALDTFKSKHRIFSGDPKLVSPLRLASHEDHSLQLVPPAVMDGQSLVSPKRDDRGVLVKGPGDANLSRHELWILSQPTVYLNDEIVNMHAPLLQRTLGTDQQCLFLNSFWFKRLQTQVGDRRYRVLCSSWKVSTGFLL